MGKTVTLIYLPCQTKSKRLKKEAMSDRIESAKNGAALKALTFVKPGMKIGLGTGSTTRYFIEALGRSGLDICAVATSEASLKLAKAAGIPLIDPEKIDHLDLTVDGADEIAPDWTMIKGGGGALLREKIAASLSEQMIVIVDEGKVVNRLGKHPLPVEVLPWGKEGTRRMIEELGLKGQFRKGFVTDNHNVIFDIHFPHLIDEPKTLEQQLQKIPGVVATGLFFNLPTHVIVGTSDGTTQQLEKRP
jgi:ribose 5-phosphate isomerase A